MRLFSSRDWAEVVELPARDHSFTVPNLKEGEEVLFRIVAVNAAGRSEPSRPTDAIIVQDQPGLFDLNFFVYNFFIFIHR